MSHTDPIADALTRIRNAQRARHETVDVRVNKAILAILGILKKEGYIAAFYPYKEGHIPMAKVELKYYEGKPVIAGIERISKPGLRIYRSIKDIPPTLNNLGITILSTPKGIMTDKEARFHNVGGEVLCKVY
ncbi:MAG: 30S ribosomal protein S8 [Leptospiraceae bacterium]|nr:30S ribosomal protein S8 [Leptospiraceae bacterium]MDW8306068.1 30S ribosomal protein S8 [Leptospiraceae bacterium]